VIDLQRIDATLAHAKDLGPRLRQADQDEVMAACGMTGEDALILAVAHAKQAHAWILDGELVAISGISGSLIDQNVGVIWMLASDGVDRVPKLLLKGQRQYVRDLLQGHDMLLNFVDNRNIKAQRWLRWLGFQVGDPRPFGAAGLLFRPFLMSAHGEHSPQPSPGCNDSICIEVSHV
jgi:hypothetical protein